MVTASASANRNDEIREEIIRYLYDIHKNAKGIKSIQVPISKFKKAMKEKGFKQQEVVPNLDFLIQTGYVVKVDEPYSFPTKKGLILNKQKFSYKISDLGIGYFEGISKFQGSKTPSIKIENTNGVVVVGHGNYVYNQHMELYNTLDMLSHRILVTSALSEQDKVNVLAELQTIKSQLAKQQPDKSTVSKAWDKIVSIGCGIGTLVDVIERVGELIHAFVQ